MEIRMADLKDTAMSLNSENNIPVGSTAQQISSVLTQLETRHRLRQPNNQIVTELNDYGNFNNGSTSPIATAGSPWPMKNNQLPTPNTGEPRSIWNTQNTLFDFSSLTAPSTGTGNHTTNNAEWQNLKGLSIQAENSPWNPPQQQHNFDTKKISSNGLASAAAVQSPAPNPTAHQTAPPGFEKETAFCSCSSDQDQLQAKERSVAYCEDCKDHMCETCYHAHLRVKLTKDHRITWLNGKNPHAASATGTSSSASSSAAVPSSLVSSTASPLPTTPDSVTSVQQLPPLTAAAAQAHSSLVGGNLVPGLNRSVVQADVPRQYVEVYQGAVEKAKSESKDLMNRASVGINQIDEAQGHIQDMLSRIDLRCNSVKNELVAITQNYMMEIKKREDFLLKRLDLIRRRKIAVLETQSGDLKQAQQSLKSMTEQLTLCSTNGHEMKLIKSTNDAMESLKEVHNKCGNLMVQEDDIVEFTYPEPTLLKTLANFSALGGSGYAPYSLADGDGLKKAILGKDARFIVVLKDQLGEQRTVGGEVPTVNIVGPDGRIVRRSIFDGQNGTYRVIWKPSVVGEHFINITVKDLNIQHSPFRVNVRMGRNYKSITDPVALFGSEGETEGQLCRPWGICCTKNGLILVANRSNNRIEVFDKEGRFQYKFGKGGK